MEFSKMLKSDDYAAAIDSSTFNKWNTKAITTKEAINRFKDNNKIPSYVVIDPADFERYMNSLGYFGEDGK